MSLLPVRKAAMSGMGGARPCEFPVFVDVWPACSGVAGFCGILVVAQRLLQSYNTRHHAAGTLYSERARRHRGAAPAIEPKRGPASRA